MTNQDRETTLDKLCYFLPEKDIDWDVIRENLRLHYEQDADIWRGTNHVVSVYKQRLR